MLKKKKRLKSYMYMYLWTLRKGSEIDPFWIQTWVRNQNIRYFP